VPTVELVLVGRLRVLVDGRELTSREVGTRKARLLLQRLAAARGEAMPVDALADAVWGDAPPGAPADNLATLVSRLRSAIGQDVVVGDRTGWRLGPTVQLDLDAATSLLAQAEAAAGRGEPAVAAAAALAAIRHMTGVVLADAPSATWSDDLRDQAAVILRRARRTAAQASHDSGDPAAAVEVATEAVRTDPYDEASVRVLMKALHETGETARALAVYETLRRGLAEDLGTDPAAQTRALHLELLTEAEPSPDGGPVIPRPAAGRAVHGQRARSGGPALAGRALECRLLQDRWTEAVGGRPGLLLVTGEPGIGKTRLTEELADYARQTGGTVLSARCYETERSLFLQPLVDALRPDLLRSSPAVLRELVRRAPALATLIPDVAAVVWPIPVERHSPETERRLAYEAIATVLRQFATRGPVLLLLDDLHNAGLATVEQLHLLSRTAGSEPLLVAATLRTAEGSEAVRRLELVSEQLALGPLTDEAVHLLAEAAGHSDLGDSIARRTRGHALSVVEMLRAIGAGEEGVPASLTAAVLGRVSRLGVPEQELVRAACVLGTSFEPGTVAALLSVPTAVAVRGSAQLVEAGLVIEAGRSYEFANDLVQEVLYASTPEPTRYAYHRLAMDLLADRPEAAAAHAAACGQPDRAAAAWREAAQAAATRFAAADAERIFGLALDAAQQGGDETVVAHVLLQRGNQRETLGRYAEAVADFTQALELSARRGMADLEMQVHRALAGDAPVALGRPLSSCIPHLHDGLTIATRLGDDATAAELLARLAILWCNRLDFRAGREYALAAVAAGRRSGDSTALRFGLDGLKTSYTYVGDLAGLATVTAELDPLARRAGDLFLLQWAVFEQAFIPLAAGDWDRAAALIEEATALTRRSGRVKYEGWLLAHLGWLARLAGHTDDAIGHGRRSVAAVPPDGHSWFGATANAMLAVTLLGTGKPAHRSEAVRLLRAGLAAADRSGAEGYRLRCMAPLAEATGSTELLVQADRILRDARLPSGHAWVSGTDAYLALGRAWLTAGEPQQATAVLESLVGPAEATGWSALLHAAGAYDLLQQCRHSSDASREATRSAPSDGTGR
jgi:DNA-binding SARP family transcriptional activator/tetratricopeptide (TPR) repeat protein